MIKSTQSTLLEASASVPLCLLLIVNFLKYHGFSLLDNEVVLISVVVATLALVVGLCMSFLGRFGVPILILILTFFFIEIQFQLSRAIICSIIALMSILFLLCRTEMVRVFALFVSFTFVALIFTPTSKPRDYDINVELEKKNSHAKELPLVIHLIMDEFVGLNGVPEFGKYFHDRLKNNFLNQGFKVYGKTYSRSYFTQLSIPSILNFGSNNFSELFVPRNSTFNFALRKSHYFEALIRRGYRLRIYQTNYFDFCVNSNLQFQKCRSISWDNLSAIKKSDLTTADKWKLIFAALGSRSRTLKNLDYFQSVDSMNLSPISAVSLLNDLKRDISQNARPGVAYFAHLIFPHYPYMYDSTCALRDYSEWGFNSILRAHEINTNRRKYIETYQKYFDQIDCAQKKITEIIVELKNSHLFKNAFIVIHSDHGSRIGINFDRKSPRHSREWLDKYSSFFAVKHINVKPILDQSEEPVYKVLADNLTEIGIIEADPIAWTGVEMF